MRVLLKQIQERSIQAKRTVSTEELLEFYIQIADTDTLRMSPGEMPS
jgi:hypothetical protein